MKKTITLIIVGALLGSTMAFAASRTFSDVPENTWYTDAVNSLSEKGIISGYPDGTFGPTNNVNRAELVVILDRLIEYIETGEITSKCDLVPDSGPCEANFLKYYFDNQENTCKEFIWGGCEGTVPFETLDECQNACE